MAHFAKIKSDGVVDQVLVVTDCAIGGCIGPSSPDYAINPEQHANCGSAVFPATEPLGQTFLASLGLDGEWKQTSYNKNFRGNFAGQGMIYDLVHDAFIEQQPYPSWTLNTTTYQWQAPVAYPTDGRVYWWDEATLSWKAV